MTQLTIKHGTVNIKDELFNFHFPQLALTNWEQALRDIGVDGDIGVKDWAEPISESEFLYNCRNQPYAENNQIYFSSLNVEQIKVVLKSDNPAQAVINYLMSPQTEVAQLSADIANEQAEAEKQEQQYREECFNNFKNELEVNSVKEIDEKKLRFWIKQCDKALLDNILAYFKDEEGVKASAVSTKRNKVVKLVVERDDKNIAGLIYHACCSVTSHLTEIDKTKKEHDAAKEVFDAKIDEYVDAKKGLKDEKEYLAEMSEMLIVEQDPNACAILQREQLKRDLAKAKKKRDSIKRHQTNKSC